MPRKVAMFAGYLCSAVLEADGLPTSIYDQASGRWADLRRSKFGTFYSWKEQGADDKPRYGPMLCRIPNGAQLPELARFRFVDLDDPRAELLIEPGLAAAQLQGGGAAAPAQLELLPPPDAEPAALEGEIVDEGEAAAAGNPFATIGPGEQRQLHDLGRKVYGDTWAQEGKQLITAATDGASASSSELTPEQWQDIMAGLRAEEAARRTAAYAG